LSAVPFFVCAHLIFFSSDALPIVNDGERAIFRKRLGGMQLGQQPAIPQEGDGQMGMDKDQGNW